MVGRNLSNEQSKKPDSDSSQNGEWGPGNTIRLSRRQFCNGLILTSAGLVTAQKVTGHQPPQKGTLVEYPPMKIDCAERLLPGSSLYFDYPSPKDPAVLTRSEDGEFSAYSRRCSHAGCSVEFDVARKCLKCPCHQGAYDPRAGDVVFGPPRKPLDLIVLQMRAGGQIWAIGKIIGRTSENIV